MHKMREEGGTIVPSRAFAGEGLGAVEDASKVLSYVLVKGDKNMPQDENVSKDIHSADVQYILGKLKEFEQAHDLTIGQLHSRISFLEKRMSDMEMKHGALLAYVYSPERKK